MFCQSKSTMTAGCEAVIIEILNVIVSELGRFPLRFDSPGRIAACAGVRAFLHRMVACSGTSEPNPNTGNPISVPSNSLISSQYLLDALQDAVPKLVKPLDVCANWTNGGSGLSINGHANVETDIELRLHEIRDMIPLFIQIILRYKVGEFG